MGKRLWEARPRRPARRWICPAGRRRISRSGGGSRIAAPAARSARTRRCRSRCSRRCSWRRTRVPAGSWLRSHSSSCHALQSPVSGSGALASFQRGRNQRMRLLLGSLRSDAVIIDRPGGSASASTWVPRLRTQKASRLSAITMLKGRKACASSSRSIATASAASAKSSASSTSSPRLRLPSCGPSVLRRLSTPATTPASLTPSHVPPASSSRPATTSLRSGQWRAGGDHGRSAISSRLLAHSKGQLWPGR